MIHKILKGLAPIAALAGAALIAGCDNMHVSIGDGEGVPLSELDMAGKAPTELILASPDKVIVAEGSELDIAVSGDERAVEALRFNLDGDALSISREKEAWKGKGIATVRVTMPALKEIVLAGSGDIAAAKLADNASVTIAGSGKVSVTEVDAESLDLNVLGSGALSASGRAGKMDLNIAGSGKSDLAGLTVDTAEVNVAGSGDAEFASDGTVKAHIMGSGSVTVNGRAECTVSSMGSGKLRCRDVTEASASATTAPKAPAAPPAPEAPKAPPAPDA